MKRSKEYERLLARQGGTAKHRESPSQETEQIPAPLSEIGMATLMRGEPKAPTPATAGALQRQLSNTLLQRLANEGDFAVSADAEATLEAERGGGQPLSTPARAQMEAAFGTDFEAVRVHTDPAAATLARQLSARAFTHGKDVYFAEGEYEPASESGQRTLAHELAHVVQQSDGAKLIVGAVNDPTEQQADAVAEQVVNALRVGDTSLAERNIQRQVEEEEEEEEPIQMLRRQIEEEEEEEELIQPLRRQVEPEEEEEEQEDTQALVAAAEAKAHTEDESADTTKDLADENQAQIEEEEDIQALKRQAMSSDRLARMVSKGFSR